MTKKNRNGHLSTQKLKNDLDRQFWSIHDSSSSARAPLMVYFKKILRQIFVGCKRTTSENAAGFQRVEKEVATFKRWNE